MYDLFIADKLFSSWSMRGWLMLEKFSLPYKEHMIGLFAGTMAQDMAELAPARLVPTLRTPEGTVIGESLAIAETLAERHPETEMWPTDPTERATARWLCAEMVGGFSALRAECPMQLRLVWEGFEPSEAVLKDLTRLEQLWSHARRVSKTKGPWLFGVYSLADVFYTPVAARIVGYRLPVSDESLAYCECILSEPAVQRWRKAALTETYDPMPYAKDLPTRAWPYP